LFHANHLKAEGRELPDVYQSITGYFNQIDTFKSFLPPEERERLTLPAANSCTASTAAVDWQQLEEATYHVWQWILDELIVIVRNEGHHTFLRTRWEKVCSSFRYRSSVLR
jgi:hypothetical protein